MSLCVHTHVGLCMCVCTGVCVAEYVTVSEGLEHKQVTWPLLPQFPELWEGGHLIVLQWS